MKFVAYHTFILRYELRILLLGQRISEAGVTQANILFHFFYREITEVKISIFSEYYIKNIYMFHQIKLCFYSNLSICNKTSKCYNMGASINLRVSNLNTEGGGAGVRSYANKLAITLTKALFV